MTRTLTVWVAFAFHHDHLLPLPLNAAFRQVLDALPSLRVLKANRCCGDDPKLSEFLAQYINGHEAALRGHSLCQPLTAIVTPHWKSYRLLAPVQRTSRTPTSLFQQLRPIRPYWCVSHLLRGAPLSLTLRSSTTLATSSMTPLCLAFRPSYAKTRLFR